MVQKTVIETPEVFEDLNEGSHGKRDERSHSNKVGEHHLNLRRQCATEGSTLKN